MRVRHWLTVALIAFASSAAPSENQLSYAGWTVDSTIKDGARRYPHSQASDSSIDVAETDAHDDIQSVSVGDGWVQLAFGTRTATGRDTFPLCSVVFDRIYRSYGGPDIVQHLHEEATPVHRRVWKRGTEHLALRCFSNDGERYAERVELYRLGDAAT